MHHHRKAAFTLIELLVVIAIIAIIAAILFPVFAAARDKARQAACFSNLKQIGYALHMYLEDYDERLPICCSPGRIATQHWGQGDLTGACAQAEITAKTPLDTFLGPEQTPPRYIQELLHPYVKNSQIWFCPSVGKDRNFRGVRTWPTYGYNGTTYCWNDYASPSVSAAPPELRRKQPVQVGGLSVAAIPRPSEAPLLWDMPHWNPVREPCLSRDLKPAHGKGLNVVYADTRVRFSPFTGRPTPEDAEPCLENWFVDNNWRGFFE